MSHTAVAVSKEHITKTPGICGGEACIAGTRVRVLDVVYQLRSGIPIAEIGHQFARIISLAEVHAAIVYYNDHSGEIEQLIREDIEADEYGQLNPSPLTLHLNELQQEKKSGVKTDSLPVG